MTDTFLHALVATLSTGPVGFSDALGYTNASLIKATCDSAGLILKPSLPLAAIDRTFSIADVKSSVLSQRAVPTGSHVWTTHTAAGDALLWYMVLSISVQHSWTLFRGDLWPPLPLTQDVVVWDYSNAASARLVPGNTTELSELQTTHGHPESSVGDDMQPLSQPPPLPSPLDFSYKLIAPVMPFSGGWALLGEVDKLTPVSEQRQWDFDFAEGFLLRISGVVGESVTVAAWKGGSVYTKSIQIGDNGEGAIVFESFLG